MPRLRLLADGAVAHGSGFVSIHGSAPVYGLPAGDVTTITVDATGFAGAEFVTTVEWTAEDGGTLSDATVTGALAEVLFAMPASAENGALYAVRNAITISNDAVRQTRVVFRAIARSTAAASALTVVVPPIE